MLDKSRRQMSIWWTNKVDVIYYHMRLNILFQLLLTIIFCFYLIPAIEILSDPVKRRAFDSVDPTFDNAVPSKGEGKDNFFEAYAPVFERNARWSSKKHVPKLGTMDSSFEDVDNFYSVW